MPYRVCAESFHLDPRLVGVERRCFVARDLRAARQAKDVVNAAGPGKGIVGEIAFPATSMSNPKFTDLGRGDEINHNGTQDAA
jgi:hypothetical protein